MLGGENASKVSATFNRLKTKRICFI
jgi:hypothetical protein